MKLQNIKIKKTNPKSTGVKAFFEAKSIWVLGHRNTCICIGCKQSKIKYITKNGNSRSSNR